MPFRLMKTDLGQAKKLIDNIAEFDVPLKMLRFVGGGEPLIHPDLPEIISYAKKKNIASFIEILTNGSLLRPELNKRLVDSGLDRIRISVEGISSEQYYDIARIHLNWNEFLENLRDLYEHRNNCSIYIKTLNISVPTEKTRQIFYDTFGPFCDQIGIEYIMPTYAGIESEFNLDEGKTIFGNMRYGESKLCAFPFYSLMVNPEGDVTLCCADWERKIILGNVFQTPLTQIWNGSAHLNVLRGMLREGREKYQVCADCFFPSRHALDRLDDYREHLLSSFGINT